MASRSPGSASRTPRLGPALGAGTWPLSGLLVLFHVRNDLLHDPRQFAVAWTWLVAVGCLGVPVYGLRVLGDRLTAAACRTVGMCATGASLLITALVVTGQLAPRTPILYASLILPMAIAIQGLNGAEALARRQRAYERGRHDAYAEILQDRRALAQALAEMNDSELEDLRRQHKMLGNVISARETDDERNARARRGELHALPSPDDRRSG